MSTIFAGCHRSCCISFCSVAATVCTSGVWNIFVEVHLVMMNGLSGCPQLEMVPESIITVHWLVAYGGGTYTLVIVTVASTHPVSKVSWVNLVLTSCVSTVVLVSHCWLDSALDIIPHNSVFLLFLLWSLLVCPRFCHTTVAFCPYSFQGGRNHHPGVRFVSCNICTHALFCQCLVEWLDSFVHLFGVAMLQSFYYLSPIIHQSSFALFDKLQLFVSLFLLLSLLFFHCFLILGDVCINPVQFLHFFALGIMVSFACKVAPFKVHFASFP